MSKYIKKNLGSVDEEGYDIEMCECYIKNEDVIKLWSGNTKKITVEIHRNRPKEDDYSWFGLMSDFPYEEVND